MKMLLLYVVIGFNSGNVILYDLYQHKLNEFVNDIMQRKWTYFISINI